ncbi:glycosyltransferase family 8 protein [Pseudochelatococcus sp. B33]
MSERRIICFTPDRNFFPTAVFAAKRLLAEGLDPDITVAIACTPDDIDETALQGADPRLVILSYSFDMDGELSLAQLPLGRHLTAAAWRRLLLPYIMPDGFERIVYLDCDTLAVRPELGRLMTLDLGGLPFAAGLDMILLKDFEDGPLTAEFQAYRAGLGFARDTPYFNSGVLLIDRRRWLEARLSERAIAFARQYPGQCRFQDQSALNVVARGEWAALSPRFNFVGDFLRLDLMREIEPVVLHFVNDPKPWQRNRWRGPAWMQALYDTPRGALPAPGGEPLTLAFQRFRERLLAFLATQRFVDGFTLPTGDAPASRRP